MTALKADIEFKRLDQIDESSFKARDLPLVFSLERFLERQDMPGVYVGGSVVTRNPRAYGDVDLLVLKYGDYFDTLRVLLNAADRSSNPLDLKGVRIEYLGKKMMYLNHEIDYRFKLTRGQTVLDLCFEGGGVRHFPPQPSKN